MYLGLCRSRVVVHCASRVSMCIDHCWIGEFSMPNMCPRRQEKPNAKIHIGMRCLFNLHLSDTKFNSSHEENGRQNIETYLLFISLIKWSAAISRRKHGSPQITVLKRNGQLLLISWFWAGEEINFNFKSVTTWKFCCLAYGNSEAWSGFIRLASDFANPTKLSWHFKELTMF